MQTHVESPLQLRLRTAEIQREVTETKSELSRLKTEAKRVDSLLEDECLFVKLWITMSDFARRRFKGQDSEAKQEAFYQQLVLQKAEISSMIQTLTSTRASLEQRLTLLETRLESFMPRGNTEQVATCTDHQNAKEHWGQCEQASRKDRTVCLDCLIRGIDGSSCESEQHNSLSKVSSGVDMEARTNAGERSEEGSDHFKEPGRSEKASTGSEDSSAVVGSVFPSAVSVQKTRREQIAGEGTIMCASNAAKDIGSESSADGPVDRRDTTSQMKSSSTGVKRKHGEVEGEKSAKGDEAESSQARRVQLESSTNTETSSVAGKALDDDWPRSSAITQKSRQAGKGQTRESKDEVVTKRNVSTQRRGGFTEDEKLLVLEFFKSYGYRTHRGEMLAFKEQHPDLWPSCIRTNRRGINLMRKRCRKVMSKSGVLNLPHVKNVQRDRSCELRGKDLATALLKEQRILPYPVSKPPRKSSSAKPAEVKSSKSQPTATMTEPPASSNKENIKFSTRMQLRARNATGKSTPTVLPPDEFMKFSWNEMQKAAVEREFVLHGNSRKPLSLARLNDFLEENLDVFPCKPNVIDFETHVRYYRENISVADRRKKRKESVQHEEVRPKNSLIDFLKQSLLPNYKSRA